ncbi:MAG: cupin domain-containing protein [Halobacteriales archaeon]
MVDIVDPDSVSGEEPSPGVVARQLVAGEEMNAQHVRLEPGAEGGDGHSHPHEQVTFVARGSPTMTIGGEDHDLEAGDTVLIPGGTTHSAANDAEEPAVLVDVFSPVREDLVD